MTDNFTAKKEIVRYFQNTSIPIFDNDISEHDVLCNDDWDSVIFLNLQRSKKMIIYKKSLTPNISKDDNEFHFNLSKLNTEMLLSFYSPLGSFEYVRLYKNKNLILDMCNVDSFNLLNPLFLSLFSTPNKKKYDVVYKLNDKDFDYAHFDIQKHSPFLDIIYTGCTMDSETRDVVWTGLKDIFSYYPFISLIKNPLIHTFPQDACNNSVTVKKAYDKKFNQLLYHHDIYLSFANDGLSIDISTENNYTFNLTRFCKMNDDKE
jgi:hypothetical protein